MEPRDRATATVDAKPPVVDASSSVVSIPLTTTSKSTGPKERHPFHEPLPPESELAKGLGIKFANLSPATCAGRLRQAKLPVKKYRGAAKGVANPLYIDGPIGGIRYRVAPKSSPYGVVDCRMVLVLQELGKLLEPHDVAEVRIDNIYRPRAHLPRKKKLSQHAYGLALDIVSFTLKDGRTLNVEDDWHGELGSSPCGSTAVVDPETDESVRLRNLLCDVARRGLFHHILTPSYNAAHKNHFHWDIQRDGRWYSVN